jgi:hypothetical protein
MSSIVPPFDSLPNIPGKVITEVKKNIDKSIDSLVNDTTRFVKSVTKLPKNCNCDDPDIRKIKQQLATIQKQLTAVQNSIPKIQSTVQKVQQVVSIANTIRTGVIAAQLINPITAPVFLAQQTMLIQDAIIVNALQSLSSFQSVPNEILSKLAVIIPQLLQSIQTIGQVCNGDVNPLEYNKAVDDKLANNPQSSLVNSQIDSNQIANELFPGNTNIADQLAAADADKIINDGSNKWNISIPTEFYNEYNVADSDLIDRAAAIQSLNEQLTTIEELQKSLLEAPSKVIRKSGIPSPTDGKLGDYYINTDDDSIFGPKLSNDSWSPIQ